MSPSDLTRNFQFEARQQGRRVAGRICATTVFTAMRILRMTGLEAIRIRELEIPSQLPPEARAAG